MKKKLLPLALAAAAGFTGIHSAQAVHVNQDGTGQVLLYPFYSVEGTQDTYISVANTTNRAKAVKVRFLEAMNSREVLDFNLYLSPEDHWSAVITRNASGDGAVIKTADTSCTSPLSLRATAVGTPGQTIPFRNFEYQDDSVKGLDRTQEGYVEIIEMGELTDEAAQAPAQTGDYATAATHVNGVPADCTLLHNEAKPASANGGTSGDLNLNANGEVTAAAGGLYGYAVLIDPAEGTAASYDAVAIDNFFDPLVVNHTEPGSLLPSLASAQNSADQILFTGGAYSAVNNTFTAIQNTAGTATVVTTGLQAVSSVLMSEAIANDYVLEPALNAGTDWVITFPTKRDYVNTGDTTLTNVAPFLTAWDEDTSSSCEEITIDYWDREEGTPVTPVGDSDFSPKPPTPAAAVLSLCYEANVMTFNSSDVLNGSDRVKRDLSLEDGFNNGWSRVNFFSSAGTLAARTFDGTGGDTTTFNGLPVIGFAVQQYVNGDVAGAVANYATSVTHKRVSAATP